MSSDGRDHGDLGVDEDGAVDADPAAGEAGTTWVASAAGAADGLTTWVGSGLPASPFAELGFPVPELGADAPAAGSAPEAPREPETPGGTTWVESGAAPPRSLAPPPVAGLLCPLAVLVSLTTPRAGGETGHETLLRMSPPGDR